MFKEFKSLADLDAAFKDENACINHFRAVRWPDGKIACPHCGVVSADHYSLKDNTHKCRDCLKKFSVRVGTIFGDSKIPLKKWFIAIFLMTSHKKGISSCQLARDIGVTQKTAWFILHRIREATMTEEFKRPLLRGTVQMDETLVGGKEQWKHADKRAENATGKGSMYSKATVFGMLSNDGELRLQTIPNTRRETIERVVRRNVNPMSKTHTDEATHYKWMADGYEHSLVKHRFGQYVSADGVHTNGIEGAFSHFKRAVTGVYHQVSDEHIDRYLGMFGWRWTRRKMGESERVNALLKSTAGHRITYRKLTRKDEGK